MGSADPGDLETDPHQRLKVGTLWPLLLTILFYFWQVPQLYGSAIFKPLESTFKFPQLKKQITYLSPLKYTHVDFKAAHIYFYLVLRHSLCSCIEIASKNSLLLALCLIHCLPLSPAPPL